MGGPTLVRTGGPPHLRYMSPQPLDCQGRVFVSMDTPTRRFCVDWVVVRLVLAIQRRVVLAKVDSLVCVGGDRVWRPLMSSSLVWRLVPASIVISMASCGEKIVPPPLNAGLMAKFIS